ncbi:MAG: hypothetical protein JWR16_1129 [Nevskia sp.]|nr:hypothetical protein [Nevskia sp.]
MDMPVLALVTVVLALTGISFVSLAVLIWRDTKAAQPVKPRVSVQREVHSTGLAQRA